MTTSDFSTLLADYTSGSRPKVHGVIAKCYDKNGREIYSKVAGQDSLGPNARTLTENAVFKYASASKLMTSIALLQCIDQGLIGLDDSVEGIVPELGQQIITGISPGSGDLVIEATKNKITPRHLLTHTSGLAYWFLNPLLMKWKKTPEGAKSAGSQKIHERCNNPLVFEPGQGWSYGVSLDWAGVIVKRLHGCDLEDYMIEHIWKPVGLKAPFPTFCISADEAYKSRLMGGVERKANGDLEVYEFWQGDNPVDQDGGHGLCGTAKDWLTVLADLVSDAPILLKPETIKLMFEPQLATDSPGLPMLRQLRPAWEIITGPVPDDAVNHGLGGVLVLQDIEELGQPRDMLGWGGAANTIWFISKAKGTVGFLSTQLHPFGDPKVQDLVHAWKRDFWLSTDDSIE